MVPPECMASIPSRRTRANVLPDPAATRLPMLLRRRNPKGVRDPEQGARARARLHPERWHLAPSSKGCGKVGCRRVARRLARAHGHRSTRAGPPAKKGSSRGRAKVVRWWEAPRREVPHSMPGGEVPLQGPAVEAVVKARRRVGWVELFRTHRWAPRIPRAAAGSPPPASPDRCTPGRASPFPAATFARANRAVDLRSA